jgi:hypothetical protein
MSTPVFTTDKVYETDKYIIINTTTSILVNNADFVNNNVKINRVQIEVSFEDDFYSKSNFSITQCSPSL